MDPFRPRAATRTKSSVLSPTITEQRKGSLSKAIVLFLGLTLGTGLILLLFYSLQFRQSIQAIGNWNQYHLIKTARSIQLTFRQTAANLFFFSRAQSLALFLDTVDGRALGRDMIALYQNHPFYDKIRFFDDQGRERLRIQRSRQHCVQQISPELQDKSATMSG